MSNLEHYTIEELEAHIAFRKAFAEERAKMLRESVKPIMKVTISPIDDKFDKIYDDAVRWYKVFGECVNADDLKAVGAMVPESGGFNYLFNMATGKFIGGFGGGRIFIPSTRKGGFYPEKSTMDALAEIVMSNPDIEHDITDFVNAIKANQE